MLNDSYLFYLFTYIDQGSKQGSSSKRSSASATKMKPTTSPSPTKPGPYEQRRLDRIAANQERLKQLGLDKSVAQLAKEEERKAKEQKKNERLTWTVEKFVGHRVAAKRKGYWELLTRWVGYDSTGDTWEPIRQKTEEFPSLVEDYIAQNPEVGKIPNTERYTRSKATDNKGNEKDVGAKGISRTTRSTRKHSTIDIQTEEDGADKGGVVQATRSTTSKAMNKKGNEHYMRAKGISRPARSIRKETTVDAATEEDGEHEGGTAKTSRSTETKTIDANVNEENNGAVNDEDDGAMGIAESTRLARNEPTVDGTNEGDGAEESDKNMGTGAIEDASNNTLQKTAGEANKGDTKANANECTTMDAETKTHMDETKDVQEGTRSAVEMTYDRCKFDHDIQSDYKEETNPGYAKPPYYLSGNACGGCRALFDHQIKSNRTEKEGQIFVKPTLKHPVWTCRGITDSSCNHVLCSVCFQTKFLM